MRRREVALAFTKMEGTGNDFVVIDGAPQAADLAVSAIKAADFVLIPVQPSPFDGWASADYHHPAKDLSHLFETIIKHVPGPLDLDEYPLRLLVTMLDYSSYTGRIGVGRIVQGRITAGQQVAMASPGTPSKTRKVMQLMGYKNFERVVIKDAHSGDIVAVAGLEGIEVGDTVSDPENPGVLPGLEIEQPTLAMEFYPNDGPFSGPRSSGHRDRRRRPATRARDAAAGRHSVRHCSE